MLIFILGIIPIQSNDTSTFTALFDGILKGDALLCYALIIIAYQSYFFIVRFQIYWTLCNICFIIVAWIFLYRHTLWKVLCATNSFTRTAGLYVGSLSLHKKYLTSTQGRPIMDKKKKKNSTYYISTYYISTVNCPRKSVIGPNSWLRAICLLRDFPSLALIPRR